ncbi:hypothetical protein SUDANB66_06619 (plasmid) [Streptomyces sp. SudanB66_2053]
MAIDTACSSSLVAVHLACQSIWAGESEFALAGGVNLNLFSDHFLAMRRVGALSPDGRCKTFDASANGYVRSEGATVVVLAPLAVAVERGLPVYCLVRGTAVNNDGLSNGLTAPNPRAQEELLSTAYERAGVSPALVDYVECHGTGTPLGDPIEAQSIATVLGRNRKKPLRVGSVKTNIGHLEPAAGVTGLAKLALSLSNGVLPASLHFQRLNPQIDFTTSSLQVQEHTAPWPRRHPGPRHAGVSAFGLGGTNSHVVVEEYPAPQGKLLALADDSSAGLAARASALLEADRMQPCTGVTGSGRWRLAIVYRDVAELRAALSAFIQGRSHPAVHTGKAPDARPRVGFLCSGTGAHWVGMGRQLMAGSPVFRRSLMRGDHRMRALLGFSVIEELLAAEDDNRFDDMAVVQPLLFCLQVALADVWRSLGVEPDVVLGQSIGEFAAAHLSGALDFSDATLLVAAHARLVGQLLPGQGGAAVFATSPQWLTSRLGRLTVAAHIGPSATLVAGDPGELRSLAEVAATHGVASHHVRMGYAPHSPQLDPHLDRLRDELTPLSPRSCRVPMLSTVTGGHVQGGELGPHYWVRNVREPSDLVAAMRHLEATVVIEVSPHPVLAKALSGTVECFPSLQRGMDEGASLLAALAQLFIAGHPLKDVPLLHGTAGRHSGTKRNATTVAADRPHIVPVSAHSPEALVDTCRELAGYVEANKAVRISDIAYTWATGRTPLSHRAAVVANSREGLIESLTRIAAGEMPASVVQSQPRIAFAFSGSGTYWPGMGRELLTWHRGFRERLEQCDAVIGDLTGWRVSDQLMRGQLATVDVQHPVLFALQTALAQVWLDLGLVPVAVVGHSVGEIAAAYLAGALTLEDAARVVVERSRLIQNESPVGAMIAVEATADEAFEWVAGQPQLSVAAINSPTSCAISGPCDLITELEADLRHRRIGVRRVRVDRQFHGPAMDPLMAPLSRVLQAISPREASIPLLSTATEGQLNPHMDADYWSRHLRRTVRFDAAALELRRHGVDTVVEIGPHGVLRNAVEEGCGAHVVDSLRREETDSRHLLTSVTSLFARGVPMDLQTLFDDDASVVELPLPRWQRDRYWLDTDADAARRSPDAEAHPPETEPGDAESLDSAILSDILDVLGIRADNIDGAARLTDLGLDSMLAIRMSVRFQGRFGRRVASSEFLAERPVGDLVAFLVGLVGSPPPEEDGLQQPASQSRKALSDELSASEIDELRHELVMRGLLHESSSKLPEQTLSYRIAPASHGQRAIWFSQQASPDATPHNLLVAARVPAAVDTDALAAAVRALVERHPALRTVFVEAGGRPHQLILDEPIHEFIAEDASGLSDDEVNVRLTEHGLRPFDIAADPLSRVVLLTRDTEEHFLLLAFHHIIADATSIEVVARDLRELYAESESTKAVHVRPREPGIDFAAQEQDWLASPEADASLRWWTEQLSAPPPRLSLNSHFNKPRYLTYEGDDLAFAWNPDETRRLTSFARRERMSMSTVLLTGLFVTLHQATASEDIVVATALAQRNVPGTETAVGYYINTLPVRARPTRQRTFREVLREVHSYAQGLLEHGAFPLDVLASELNPPHQDGSPPWFDIVVNWLSGDFFQYANTLFHGKGSPVEPLAPLPLVPWPLKRHTATFDVELQLSEIGEQIVGRAQFKPAFVDLAAVTALLDRYKAVLGSAVDHPDRPLEELHLGSEH